MHPSIHACIQSFHPEVILLLFIGLEPTGAVRQAKHCGAYCVDAKDSKLPGGVGSILREGDSVLAFDGILPRLLGMQLIPDLCPEHS